MKRILVFIALGFVVFASAYWAGRGVRHSVKDSASSSMAMPHDSSSAPPKLISAPSASSSVTHAASSLDSASGPELSSWINNHLNDNLDADTLHEIAKRLERPYPREDALADRESFDRLSLMKGVGFFQERHPDSPLAQGPFQQFYEKILTTPFSTRPIQREALLRLRQLPNPKDEAHITAIVKQIDPRVLSSAEFSDDEIIQHVLKKIQQ